MRKHPRSLDFKYGVLSRGSSLEERNNDYNLDSILECNDFYEYDVVTVHDFQGRTDTNNLKKTLIRYSVQGALCGYRHNAPYADKDIMPS